MNHEDLKIREGTRFVLVHFTGEDLSTYEHIKQSHLQEGEPEIGFHFIITAQGKTLMGRHVSKIGSQSKLSPQTWQPVFNPLRHRSERGSAGFVGQSKILRKTSKDEFSIGQKRSV